jgi:hypothetical protein
MTSISEPFKDEEWKCLTRKFELLREAGTIGANSILTQLQRVLSLFDTR